MNGEPRAWCVDDVVSNSEPMRRAFSMLELVVVMVVIGVLVAVAVPRMSRAQEASRFASTFATFNAIARAAEYYRADRGGRIRPTTCSGRRTCFFVRT